VDHKAIKSLLVCLVLHATSALTQTFTFVPRDTALSAPVGQEIVFECTITNVSAAPLTLMFIRTMNALPVGWESSMCITVCYPPNVDTLLAPTIAPGDTLPFSLHVYAFTNPGTGMARVLARNTRDSLDQRAVTFHPTSTPVSVKEGDAPAIFSLEQNYPNPFNPTTRIVYTVDSRQSVQLKVYDVLGREVATLVNAVMPPGSHTVNWDASGLSSGVYLYRLQTGAAVETRKLVLAW
jgi:hypothetical protein